MGQNMVSGIVWRVRGARDMGYALVGSGGFGGWVHLPWLLGAWGSGSHPWWGLLILLCGNSPLAIFGDL